MKNSIGLEAHLKDKKYIQFKNRKQSFSEIKGKNILNPGEKSKYHNGEKPNIIK